MDDGDQISATSATGSRHVVAIPYPGRGHINPMINLCRLLADKRLNITIILTDEWHDLITSGSPAPLPPNVQLRAIPNVLPSERTRGSNYAEFFEAVLHRMGEPVQRLLDELEPTADIVVADALLPWVVDICEKRSVPAVSLWTESVSVFRALYTFDRLDAAGELPADFSGNQALAYLPNVSTPHLAALVPNATNLDLLRLFAHKYYWFHTAHSLLVTSFGELEASVISQIRSEFAVPIYQIGPSIPHMVLPSHETTAADHDSYLTWLDKQPKCSVLYISLGSFLPISGSQMAELAAGLVESGVLFLWVVRDKADVAEAANSFIVPWCDQLGVLCHPAVGGFLTHCGWNSTLEAVYAGVPMLTFPLFWDQNPNSKLIVEDWRIGLRLKGEGVITRECVVKMVRKLMDLDDEDNKEMRRRTAELKDICRGAVTEGGSSAESLDEFVRMIS